MKKFVGQDTRNGFSGICYFELDLSNVNQLRKNNRLWRQLVAVKSKDRGPQKCCKNGGKPESIRKKVKESSINWQRWAWQLVKIGKLPMLVKMLE